MSLTRLILPPPSPSPSPPLLTVRAGEYNKHKEKGVYNCAGCDAPLYKSDTKFDSGCGWPAFYAAIPGTFTILPSLHPLLLSCLLFSLLTMQVWGKFDAVWCLMIHNIPIPDWCFVPSSTSLYSHLSLSLSCISSPLLCTRLRRKLIVVVDEPVPDTFQLLFLSFSSSSFHSQDVSLSLLLSNI